MKELWKEADRIIREGEELANRFDTIQKSRTDFQLAHFVVAQHDRPARQWWQAVLELQVQAVELERAKIRRERKLREMRKVKDDLDRADLLIDLKLLDWEVLGRIRECATLLAILKELERQHGGPYTREEIEEDEAHYWQLRLSRQAYFDARTTGTIGHGNMDAILQTMVQPGMDRPRMLQPSEIKALLGIQDPETSPIGEDGRGTRRSLP